MRRRRLPLEEATINLTPLIDVVFVVLIMFILVAPLLDVDRVQLAHAAKSAQNAAFQQKSPVQIHVHENNSVTFNNRKIALKELGLHLAKAKKQHPKASVELYHDSRASFGTYQSVKNATEAAGFTELLVILRP